MSSNSECDVRVVLTVIYNKLYIMCYSKGKSLQSETLEEGKETVHSLKNEQEGS